MNSHNLDRRKLGQLATAAAVATTITIITIRHTRNGVVSRK